MNGLLDAARQNLWAVVNELGTLQPPPQLRVALLTYGCSAYAEQDGWVRIDTGFTQDLDLVSKQLFALTTNGGDEYVGRVVQTALQQLQWTDDPKALKLLFVAGNEAATQDPQVDSKEQCKAAIARGIVVDSIYCGDGNDQLAPAWRELAQLADGQFAAIDQNHNTAIETPFDRQLTELSSALSATYLPYGKLGCEAWANQRAQDGNAAGLNAANAAQRCQTKGSGLYHNPQWDLVDACKDPAFALDKVAVEDLPEAMRSMDGPARAAHVAAMRQQRDVLRQQVDALGKQRDAFVQQLQQDGDGRFERAVLQAVRQQAEAHGFRRPTAVPSQEKVSGGQRAGLR